MATLYINGANGQVTVTDPTQQGQVVTEVLIPEGLPVQFLSRQIQQLAASLADRPEDAIALVFKIQVGD